MPRKARIDAPNALHHIIVRGIEKNPIFKDNQDYANFLTRLGAVLTETSTVCYAWALMRNHIHLLLRTGNKPISTVMRRLLTGYAQQFNRRHNRHGYLFQNRYKSFLCETDPYLLELIRYIHLNPIRAGVVQNMETLDTYRRTGHAVLMGNINHEWQDTEYVLSLFGRKVSRYRLFVQKGISQGKRPELTGGGLIRSAGGWKTLHQSKDRIISDERILGSSEFVASVLKHARENYEKRMRSKQISLSELIKVAAEYCNVDESLIKSPVKQRKVVQSRAIIIHIAVDRLWIAQAELARYLNMTPSAVSKLVVRGRIDPLAEKIEEKVFQALDESA